MYNIVVNFQNLLPVGFPHVWQLFHLQLPEKHVKVSCTARSWLWAQPGPQPRAGTLWANHSNRRGQEKIIINQPAR